MGKYAVPYKVQVPMGNVRLTDGRLKKAFENNIEFFLLLPFCLFYPNYETVQKIQ